MKCLIVLALVTAVSASGSHTYHGHYSGKCGNDGLYFRDSKSFVFCSNGNSYEQPCAPGTRNSAYGKYSYGGKYNYRDFCDVNLVDEGYAAKHAGYGYNNGYNNNYNDGYGYDNNRYDRGHDRDYDGYGRRDYGYGRRDYGYGRRDYGYN